MKIEELFLYLPVTGREAEQRWAHLDKEDAKKTLKTLKQITRLYTYHNGLVHGYPFAQNYIIVCSCLAMAL